MCTIVALFGYRKSFKEGVLVSIEVDEESLSGSSEKAKYISNPAKRGFESWWIVSLELSKGSVVKLDTKVGVRGKGQDSERTTCQWFTVDPEYPIKEIRVPRVGFKNYPLLKGRLKTISSKSLQDETEQMIEGLLNENEDED